MAIVKHLSEPLTAGYLVLHVQNPSHEFSMREVEELTTGTWGSLCALHRGDHEGRDQDHVHEGVSGGGGGG